MFIGNHLSNLSNCFICYCRRVSIDIRLRAYTISKSLKVIRPKSKCVAEFAVTTILMRDFYILANVMTNLNGVVPNHKECY